MWPVDFDADHEGYYGKKTAYVTTSVIANLNKFEKPDVAIIHLGTNDSLVTEDSISTPLKQVIKALRIKNPVIKVLLVQIPGWQNLKLHFLVWKAGLALNTGQSPVKTVPLYYSWDSKIHTFDGAHPNPLGQKKIADLLYDYIMSN